MIRDITIGRYYDSESVIHRGRHRCEACRGSKGACRRAASSEAEHSGVLSVTGFHGPCHDTTESVQKQTRGYLESQKNELFS